LVQIGTLLDRPRTATVQAISPSQVVELSRSVLRAHARQSPGLRRVLACALEERVGLSHCEVDKVLPLEEGGARAEARLPCEGEVHRADQIG
jgi:CRP-like cAMP-binding protein